MKLKNDVDDYNDKDDDTNEDPDGLYKKHNRFFLDFQSPFFATW